MAHSERDEDRRSHEPIFVPTFRALSPLVDAVDANLRQVKYLDLGLMFWSFPCRRAD